MKRVGKRGEDKFEQISWDEATTPSLANSSASASVRRRVHHRALCFRCVVRLDGDAVVNRLINLNGGCLNYTALQLGAHFGCGHVYLCGGTYGSNFLTSQDNQLVVMFGNSPVKPVGAVLAYAPLRTGARAETVKVIIIDPRTRHGGDRATNGSQSVPAPTGARRCLAHTSSATAGQTRLPATYCVGYDEETMPGSAKGQNKSYKDYILGHG